MDLFNYYYHDSNNIDTQNFQNQEVNPHLLFNIHKFTGYTDFAFSNLKHNTYITTLIEKIESNLYYKRYYGDDKGQFIKFKKRFLSSFLSPFQKSHKRHIKDTIEDLFSDHCDNINEGISHYHELIFNFLMLIYDELKTEPISSRNFPRFISSANQTDEEVMLKILGENDENSNDNLENEQKTMFSFSDLIQFYDILSKYTKPFSFPPKLVNLAIKKFDSFLNASQKNSNNDDHFPLNYFCKLDSKSEEYHCFELILMIKLRLLMMNRQMHDFLIVLLQLLIIDQENPNMNEDDHFSFKKFMNDIIPNVTTRRTTIVKNVLNDQILDFSFSNDEQNDYILTKEGVFKLQQNFNKQIEFDTSKMTEILFNTNEENKKIHEHLKQSNNETSKITFSNGILYLFIAADNSIHKVIVSPSEEKTQKAAEKQKKLDKAKEHFEENQKKKSKKKYNKLEEDEEDENEIDLESIQIEIPKYPIISFASYDNYVRIVQRKRSDDKKMNLLFTNVDLTPNNRTNYNPEDSFLAIDKKFIQTQFEIEIKNDESIQLNDVLFSENSMYLLFNDNQSNSSYFQKWLILDNGELVLAKKLDSPCVIGSNSITKMDNKSFVYNFVPLKNGEEFGASITQFYLPETQHFLREEDDLFLKYPYLQKLSNIVNNCSQFIINNVNSRSITMKKYCEYSNNEYQTPDNNKKVNPFKLTITADEICSIIKPVNVIVQDLNDIKMLIKSIKDESLQRFFITLFIKLTGINLTYYTTKKLSDRSKIEPNEMNNLKEFRSFILDLYSLFTSSNSNSNLMICESMIFTLSIAGKFLFIQDSSYDELRSLMNQLFNNNHFIFKSLLNFMFSNISSLYFIDQPIYNKLMEMKEEIDITQLFTKNILFINYENDFSFRNKNLEFIENLSPYIKVLFNYIRYIIENESISFEAVEFLLTYVFALPTVNIYLTLILEKEMIGISSILYNRIKKIPGVLENDQEFLKKNQDIEKQEFYHETKIIESEHPYNQEPVPIPYKEHINKKNNKRNDNKKVNQYEALKKQFYIKNFGTVDFGNKADIIYFRIDHKSELQENDIIIIFSENSIQILKVCDKTLDKFNKISSNKIRIAIGRYIKDSQKVNKKFWGVKLTVIGVKENTSFFWQQNHYLLIYNHFIANLMCQHSSSKLSTKLEDAEKDFQIILDDNIIQGIKFEDIDNYEKNIKQNQNEEEKFTKTISRGMSRGISYDSEEEFQFDNKIKTDFLNKIISINEDNQTPTKRFIEAIYAKTAKKNIIKLNKSTQSILKSEHLFAACLFKQLGLITTCINFQQIINVTVKDEIQNLEFPKTLLSLWRKIYSLRNTLFYEYLKSKSNANADNQQQQQPSSFETLIKSVNQKCKMLLYSDPILHFREKDKIDDEALEESAKSILSFVISKIPLSDISKLIDIRKKRLSILKQSDSLLLSFVDQNSLFESSKPIFAFFYGQTSSIDNCLGVKQSEIQSYKQLLGELVFKMTKNIFTQPSISMITRPGFIFNNISHLQRSDSLIQTAEIIKEMIEKNKSNNSFFNKMIGSILVYILIFICLKTEDNELIDYLVSLLFDKDIDDEIKVVILVSNPALIQFTQIDQNHRILDESLIFSLIENNKNKARIIYPSFYWIAFAFEAKKEKSQNRQDFILKVLEAIGHIFLNKRCSFIDDSHDKSLQKSISLLMNFFIKLLYNQNDENLFSVAHDILTNKINNIENEKDLVISIGLFISLGENLIPTTFKFIQLNNELEKLGAIKNSVFLENKNLELDEKEIDNILKLHEYIIHSDFMNDKNEFNENPIDSKEITQSVLISSFYSFIPIIMQIKSNAEILMNEKNIQRTLSIFELAMKSNPSDFNCAEKLISQLMNKIEDATSINLSIKFNNSFKFLKANYGEVVYADGKGNDLIKTNENYINVFICNKPFYFDCETYFEIKVYVDNCKDIFIGFIDAEEKNYDKAFGFGCMGYKGSFCRKSLQLSNKMHHTADKIMKDDQTDKVLIKAGDIIGCYYTTEYTYLTINGQLTQYRISNKSLKLYIPIIIVDHEQFEIEIVRNVSIVDNSDNQFDFLKIDNKSENFFTEKDIKSLDQLNEDRYIYHEKLPLIGNTVKILPLILRSADIESIDVYPKEFINLIGFNEIIKDIVIDENPFVPKYKIDFSNYLTIKTINGEYDSRLFSIEKNNLYSVVGNLTETHLDLDDIDMKCLPKQLRNSSDLKSIQQFIIKRIIRNNSKSIAIVMARYLVFILIDFLRYSKSNLLLDDTKETQMIIKSLAFSLPTITQLVPFFDYKFNEDMVNKYLIFHDEQTEVEILNEINTDKENKCMKWHMFKIPGLTYIFHNSFKAFLKKSESFISTQFIIKILKEIYENSKNNSLSLDEIYYLIKREYKIESISPLPDSFNVKMKVNKSDNCMFIPIIVSSIPEPLPSVILTDKRLRSSSDKISYFYNSVNFDCHWKYDIKDLKNKNIDRNYKLKCGLLNLDFDLNKNLLNTPLGYIQMVFNILQSFLNSDYLYENKIEVLCNGIFEDILSLKKDILVFPFLEPLIISILSICNLSNYYNTDKIFEAFKYLSYNSYNKIHQMDSFPTSNNELPLIFKLNDDSKIEVTPNGGELVHVSFPLQILICSENGQKNLDNIKAFVVDFSPSEEQQKQFFVDNYDDIEEDFNKFIELGQYDNEISKIAFTNQDNNNNDNLNQDNDNNDNSNQDNNNNNNDENQFRENYDDDYEDNFYNRENHGNGENDNVFNSYKLDQIPKEIAFQSPIPEIQIKPSIILLRCNFLHNYSYLIESINSFYSTPQNDYSPWNLNSSVKSYWILPLSSKDKLQNLYTKQTIRPLYSMNTESKFRFINQFFMGEQRESPQLGVTFNRFEQQKFFEKFDKNENKKNVKARPLIIQFMEQVDVDSLRQMKVRGGTPFKVKLVGENPIDVGGPGRELFASLIMEIVNDHIGIFTFNPNRLHEVELTNKEDMIPNKNSSIKSFYLDDDNYRNKDYNYMFNNRFIYAGALIAICIVSDLPQQMKLASFIWEFLSIGTVSIESIYEIDNNFKQIIESAENIQKRILNSSPLSDDEFESLFMRTFEIHDSFDNVVQLVPSGSKKRVTKENLKEFIELAKNYRIHEFDKELKELKKGFDIIMCYKNVTSILNPKELELLCCGEANCSVEQMKNLFVFEFSDRELSPKIREKMIEMFWRVIESFTPEERILLIKFSSGNMGLPSPGVRWKEDIKVVILPKKIVQSLVISHTCFSTIDLPFFESEEHLSKVLKTSINFSDLITDSYENPQAVAEFL